MYPLKLVPIFKDYLWGGQKLRTDFGKDSSSEVIAESWELSCHKDGESFIAEGNHKGISLSHYIEKKGKQILGVNAEKFDEFPILIKLIDAMDNLSVQVHPDNDYALRVENEYGKTEMWYVVDCDPGAGIIYSFKKEITKEEFAQGIRENTLLDLVNSVPVKAGDVVFIEAGTLHAIGKGIVIAEIQQNSNTTYRVYDYGRIGADGKPRELHIDKGIEVTSLTPPKHGIGAFGEKQQFGGYASTLLSTCEYFHVEKLEVVESAELVAGGDSFHSILVLAGGGKISAGGEDFNIVKGDSFFIPAGMGDYEITGECELIFTTIPK